MAHYAKDCWDLEILTSFGWVECIGIADRAAFDLTQHQNGSGEKLQATRIFEQPIEREIVNVDLDKGFIGKTMKAKAKEIIQFIN